VKNLALHSLKNLLWGGQGLASRISAAKLKTKITTTTSPPTKKTKYLQVLTPAVAAKGTATQIALLKEGRYKSSVLIVRQRQSGLIRVPYLSQPMQTAFLDCFTHLQCTSRGSEGKNHCSGTYFS
jgi:hypothetical protein